MKNFTTHHLSRLVKTNGFTLLEFLVAMAVFMIVTGAVFTLFRKDDPLFNNQQNMVGVNLALQNAVTQMEIDGVNAGTGYYPGTNIPNWPIGITIVNKVPIAGDCGDNATYIYNSTCFDTLNLITVDPNTLPQHLGVLSGTINTNTATSMVLYTPGITTNAQATALAASYHTGDELLLLKVDGSQMTTVSLTANGSSAGTTVTLHYNSTNADGTNAAANDFLSITSNNGQADNNGITQLGVQYGNSDWVLRLKPIIYSVDATDPTNPKLIRQDGIGAPQDVIATQVIGFRIGAALFNDPVGATATADMASSGSTSQCSTSSDSSTPSSTTTYMAYNYNACSYGEWNNSHNPTYDFSIIRSIRVSIIGRTPPNSSGNIVTYRNAFDSGPYMIQGLSVVINPRNLSMAD
jgi:prepilin-type N-terminal cleavage/methylation domain-containing protein